MLFVGKLSWQMTVVRNAYAFPPIPLMHTVNRVLTDNWVVGDQSFDVLVNKRIIMK